MRIAVLPDGLGHAVEEAAHVLDTTVPASKPTQRITWLVISGIFQA
ncbi:MAG: hypothetical protein JWQ07_4367 [Ramlibacter sp.]|nr:hypothetical protein [Ramlibacter sp.]